MYSRTPIARYTPVKINDVLRDSVAVEIKSSPRRKMSIDEKIDSTKDLVIEADPVQLKEVFRNILNNAIEAVSKSAGRIMITSEVINSDVVILIKDNGEGIAKKDLKNISNPFFTTKVKGTGLGLAVCKQVVMLHNGSIAITSVKGKGTTVAVTLPIYQKKNA